MDSFIRVIDRAQGGRFFVPGAAATAAVTRVGPLTGLDAANDGRRLAA